MREENSTLNFFWHLMQKCDEPLLIVDSKEITKGYFMRCVELRRCQIVRQKSHLSAPVPVVSHRGWHFWVDLLALWTANKIPVPIDPQMPVQQIQYILDSIKAEFSLGALHTELPALEEVNYTNNQNTTAHYPDFSIDESNIAAILFTSGSTGLPKGVMLRFKALIGNAYATAQHLQTEKYRLAIALPFHFTSAISHFLVSIINSATLIASEEKLLPAQLVAFLNQNKANCFGGSPLQLDWLARSYTHIKTELHWLMSSGDHLSPATIHLLQNNLPKTQIHTCYGLTEVGGRCCFLNPEDLDHYAGSVGKPIHGLKINIFDENGIPCTHDTIGEIFVAGDYLMKGYFQVPSATHSGFNEKGFATGDLGYFNKEGLLYLTGRQDDVFKVNGQKVSVIPIQQQILALGKISDIAVIPYQHPLLGRIPIAFYVPKENEPLDTKELTLLLRKVLPGNHLPQKFIEIESIPRTASGKIKRRALAIHASHLHELEKGNIRVT